jgi:hypothetical protein
MPSLAIFSKSEMDSSKFVTGKRRSCLSATRWPFTEKTTAEIPGDDAT